MKSESTQILVVDDDRAVRQGLEKRLSSAGYRVRTAENGEEALRACSPEPPDIVVLDVSMPGMDGYQVCERIRDSVEKPVTVIFVTGTTHGGTSSRLQQLVNQSGGDYFFAKPYDPSLLLEMIDRISSENPKPTQE